MRLLLSILFIFFIWACSSTFVYADVMSDSVQKELSFLHQSVLSLQDTVKDLNSTVRNQNEVIEKQAVRISTLEQGRESAPQTGAVVQMPSAAPKLAGVMGFNPDIGLTSSIQGKLTQNKTDGEGNNTIALKELELNIAQVVDPFSRLDSVISFNDSVESQNANVEEAYYTRWGLPFGFTGQIGKFRSKIGKQNLLHSHQLDTVDYPLVIQNFFGEEGLASSGARLQNMIPNPWDIPFEITGEILRGNNGDSFSRISRRPIFNTHVKTYFDVTDDANLELGWTTLFGDENPPINGVRPPEGQDRYGVKVFGADATLNWFLPEGKKVKFQNEIYFQNRTNRVHANNDPWGFYSLLDYKFSQKFSVGVRFDYLEPLDVVDQHHHTIGISPYLTFWQSEFADFRLQYSRLDPASASEKPDNALYLKANVLIGAHKHPVQ